MLFLLPLGSRMEEWVQHQLRDSFPDYKKRKPCLLLIWFGILRSNFPVGSIRFHPTSYHSEFYSITLVTLVVLFVELKDWISLSVPTPTPV